MVQWESVPDGKSLQEHKEETSGNRSPWKENNFSLIQKEKKILFMLISLMMTNDVLQVNISKHPLKRKERKKDMLLCPFVLHILVPSNISRTFFLQIWKLHIFDSD